MIRNFRPPRPGRPSLRWPGGFIEGLVGVGGELGLRRFRTQVGALEETTESELRALFELHFFGPAALTRAALPHFRRQGGGAVVQMSSVADVVGPTRDYVTTGGGTQPGDPDRAAAAIHRAVTDDDAPTRPVLGPDAWTSIEERLDRLRAELATWEAVSRSTGTVGINGARPLTWHRTTDRSENVEIIPSTGALERAAAEHDVVWPDLGDFRQSASDVAVWAAAVRARRLLLTGSVTDGAVDELTVTVLAHVATDHLGARPAPRGRLGRTQVRVLADRIRADPFRPHPVAELAAAVHLSPFHFLRTFDRTVGTTPHQFVLAVRAEHVRRLLQRPGASVDLVAAQVGMDSRQLRRMHRHVVGTSPRGA